jgi:hypothetical protein
MTQREATPRSQPPQNGLTTRPAHPMASRTCSGPNLRRDDSLTGGLGAGGRTEEVATIRAGS